MRHFVEDSVRNTVSKISPNSIQGFINRGRFTLYFDLRRQTSTDEKKRNMFVNDFKTYLVVKMIAGHVRFNPFYVFLLLYTVV